MTKKKETIKLTPKQAAIQAGSILRGLDNSIAGAKREVAKLEEQRKRVGGLASGLSNLASAPAPKPAPAAKKPEAKKAAPAAKKPAPAKKPEPVKAEKKAVAKKPAPAAKKPAPAKKAPAKPAPAQATAQYKDPVPGRPSLREAVKEAIRAAGSGSPTTIYDRVCTQWGYWSKQSFYTLLKKDPEIQNKEGTVDLVASGSKKAAAPKEAKPAKKPETKKATPAKKPEDDKVDALVSRVEQDRSTAAVV